jgi:hypothetical protein
MGGSHDEGQGLAEAAASVVALRYERAIREALTEPAIGVTLLVYWDGAEAAHCSPESAIIAVSKLQWCAEHGRLDELWKLDAPVEVPAINVEYQDVYDDPEMLSACEALVAASQSDRDSRLVNLYYATLAAKLNDALKLVVCVDSYDGVIRPPIAKQVRAQLDPATARAWAAWGWRE